jgi:hypothetical protein
MDKTIQIIVMAMIMMITAVAVMTMFSSQLNPFTNTTEGQQNDANCIIQESNYQRACEDGAPTPEADDIASEYAEACDTSNWECG